MESVEDGYRNIIYQEKYFYPKKCVKAAKIAHLKV